MLCRSSIASIFAFMFSANPVQAQIAKHHQTLVRSNPIGRVLSTGDRNKQKGSFIFPGDRVNPISISGTVKILCYPNNKMLLLGEGLVDDTADKCVKPTELGRCRAKRNCSRTKRQTTNAQKPIITNPYGNIILNRRPLISWLPTPNSNSYTVVLKGNGVSWSEETTKTELPYPQNQPPLQYGNVYKLDIITNQDDSPTAARSTVLIVLSKQERQQIKNTIQQVQALNLTPDEEARDLVAVYMSQNLLTESINVLNQRINSGTNNPTLYRLLGDLYLQAGFSQKAKPMYLKARILARGNTNRVEQNLAQQGLESIEQQE